MPLAPLLLAVEQGVDRLVAMHPESHTAIEQGILGALFPQSRALPTDIVGRGFMPNVEALLTLAPELVIQWGGRGQELLEPLERAGLKTLAILYSGREQDIEAWLSLIGQVTGREQRVSELLGLRSSVREKLIQRRGATGEKMPRVLYLFRARSGFQAGGRDSYMHYAINLAGGRNVAKDLNGTAPISIEQILAWSPDVILLNSFEAGLSRDDILEHPLLSLTPAAQTKAVYQMPIGGYRWDPPSHESPLAWLWLAQRFQGQNPDIDYRKLAHEVADVLYGPLLTEPLKAQLLAPFATGGVER